MKALISLHIFAFASIFGQLPIDAVNHTAAHDTVKEKGDSHMPYYISKSYDVRKFYEILGANPFVITPEQVVEFQKHCGLDVNDLLVELILIAKSYALTPISNYHVGAAALGKSGTIYLGTNLEFLGMPLNETIHAEQFVITNARSHGEEKIVTLAVSAAPCGHCRQFLKEMSEDGQLQILIPNCEIKTLSSLLPESFGPKDLGLTANLLSRTLKNRNSISGSTLMEKTVEAANSSYAPYTESQSGIGIQTYSGEIYTGSYLENAAYNPSISPLQAALVTLVADSRDYSEICSVILVEKQFAKISQEFISRAILNCIAPEAVFQTHKLAD